MPVLSDAPLHLTFEELERDELRRAEAINPRHEDLFDGAFFERSPALAVPHRHASSHLTPIDDADDEE